MNDFVLIGPPLTGTRLRMGDYVSGRRSVAKTFVRRQKLHAWPRWRSRSQAAADALRTRDSWYDGAATKKEDCVIRKMFFLPLLIAGLALGRQAAPADKEA